MSAGLDKLLVCARCSLPFAVELEGASYRKSATPKCPHCKNNPMLASVRHLNEQRAARRSQMGHSLARWSVPVFVVAAGLVAFALYRESRERTEQLAAERKERALIVHGACASELVPPGGHDDCIEIVHAFCHDQQADRLSRCAQTTVRAYYGDRALHK